MTRRKSKCRKHDEYYEYEETRMGGYDGAWSPLVRGEYHFYKCPHGCRMADSATDPIRTEER